MRLKRIFILVHGCDGQDGLQGGVLRLQCGGQLLEVLGTIEFGRFNRADRIFFSFFFMVPCLFANWCTKYYNGRVYGLRSKSEM